MNFGDILFWGVIGLYSIFIIIFAISFLVTIFIKVPFVPSKKSSTHKLIKATIDGVTAETLTAKNHQLIN